MFYGSGNGVVKILNASDMAEIADAVQTVTWNRYTANPVYHWNRYSINTSYTDQLEVTSRVDTAYPANGYQDDILAHFSIIVKKKAGR